MSFRAGKRQIIVRTSQSRNVNTRRASSLNGCASWRGQQSHGSQRDNSHLFGGAMAQFLPAYNYMMDSEDAQRKYLTVADPVRVKPGDPPDVAQRKQTAQAISGINSYFWPADFVRILSCGPAARAYAVQQFYQAKFWTPLLLAQMNDQTVANCVLDDGVNQGDGTACEAAAGGGERCVDGEYGRTRTAVFGRGRRHGAADGGGREQLRGGEFAAGVRDAAHCGLRTHRWARCGGLGGTSEAVEGNGGVSVSASVRQKGPPRSGPFCVHDIALKLRPALRRMRQGSPFAVD